MKRFLGAAMLDCLPGIGLWLITAVYLAMAYRYKPVVRAFPAGVAWIMLALVSLDLVSRSRTPVGAALTRWLNPAAAPSRDEVPASRQIAAVLWLIGFAALLVLIGILPAVPLYLFAALRWRGKRSYGACLVGAAGATLFVWLLFSQVLRIALYPGLIFGGA